MCSLNKALSVRMNWVLKRKNGGAGKRGPEECPVLAVMLQTNGQRVSLFGAVDERRCVKDTG